MGTGNGMKIAIVGGKGMLGHDLAQACRAQGVAADIFDLPELDITRDDGGFDRLPACDWVVNCAAYTDVDGAEAKRDLAFAVNADGADRLARWCAGRRIPLLHISTDYVFDGLLGRPLREDDPINPVSVYGESKLAGERAVQAAGGRHVIVRTQVLYGVNGKSFIRAVMAKMDSSDEPLRVVKEQTMCPTYTRHLADAILRLLPAERSGVVHVSASGQCTWYEFACAIAARVKPGTVVIPVTAAEFPRPARRPLFSALDKSRYEAWTGHRMPDWREGMAAYLRELGR